jgi:hypothetical protein
MARYAIINANIISNIVEWDGGPQWSPPPGSTAELAPMRCNIGWTWNNGSPVDPNPPPPPPTLTIDLSNTDNLDKVLRAICLMTGTWAGKTPAQIKAAFLSAWQALP